MKLAAQQPYRKATYMDFFPDKTFCSKAADCPKSSPSGCLWGSDSIVQDQKAGPDASKNSLKPGPALLSAAGITFHTNNAAI